jgi:hypothetical protein
MQIFRNIIIIFCILSIYEIFYNNFALIHISLSLFALSMISPRKFIDLLYQLHFVKNLFILEQHVQLTCSQILSRTVHSN